MAEYRHKNVVDELKARGFTRLEAAKELGWQYNTFCRALRYGIVSVAMLEDIANFLGWTTDQVLGREMKTND